MVLNEKSVKVDKRSILSELFRQGVGHAGIVTFFLFVAGIGAQGQKLSNDAEISVMTLSPNQTALYSAFGHSAFRVRDPGNDFDLIYNYGIFDFNQPNFYLNFANGEPYYMLGVYNYEYLIKEAIRENRSLVEQVMNLNQLEKQKLFDFLQWNAQTENRNYYYNYVYDNCATKLRDIMDTLFPGRVQYDFSYKRDGLTIRDLMDLYLEEQPWGDLGIDICLGTGIDKEAPAEVYMFLPDYIMYGFAGATMKTDSIAKPLIKETIQLHTAKPAPSTASLITPEILFTGLFLFFGLVTFKDFKRGKRSNWIDILLFGLTGIVGWQLVYLWFFTNHISAYNFNLLWAIPFNFPVVLWLMRRRQAPWLMYYFLVVALIECVLILTWAMLPQPIPYSLVPIVLLLLLRAYTIVHFSRSPE